MQKGPGALTRGPGTVDAPLRTEQLNSTKASLLLSIKFSQCRISITPRCQLRLQVRSLLDLLGRSDVHSLSWLQRGCSSTPCGTAPGGPSADTLTRFAGVGSGEHSKGSTWPAHLVHANSSNGPGPGRGPAESLARGRRLCASISLPLSARTRARVEKQGAFVSGVLELARYTCPAPRLSSPLSSALLQITEVSGESVFPEPAPKDEARDLITWSSPDITSRVSAEHDYAAV